MKNIALKPIFDQLKPLLATYSPPLVSKHDREDYFDLWSIKDVEFAGKKRSEVFFAGIIIQKAYVGFYYMPVYTHAEAKSFFSERLLKLLKGKSCFYIKTLDDELINDIKTALDKGFALYKTNGWI